MDILTNMDNGTTAPRGLRKWAPLAILSLALTIIIIDTTVLNVSLKAIIGDLRADIQSIQWVITAYSLMLAAFTITGGRLGDFFGRKRMFVLGAIIFAVGSFITSVSYNVGVMIVGEAIIEGIGACLMLPATASLLVANYRGRDRQIAFGIWGGLAAASAAVGPIFGGWLTTYYSWRWAFRINIVVAALLVIGASLIGESFDREEKPEIDYGGILFSSLGLLLVVFGLIESSTYGWWQVVQPFSAWGYSISGIGSLSATPFFIALGIVFLQVFVLWELRMQRLGKTPLVSFSLFKNSQFAVAASVTAVLALVQTGVFFAMPVFLQGVKHLDALDTGIALLPMTLAILVSAPFSAYMSKYITPKRIILAGLVVDAIGFLLLRSEISAQASQWALAPGFIVSGIGMGFLFSQTTNMALSAVSVQESGEASGVNTTMRQLGATLGSAILGSILLSVVSAAIISGITTSPTIPEEMKSTIVQHVSQESSSIEITGTSALPANIPPSVASDITAISDQATVQGNQAMLLYGAAFVVVGFILALWLPGGKNIETAHSAAHS